MVVENVQKSTVCVQDVLVMYSGEAWYFEISYGTTSGEKRPKGENGMNGTYKEGKLFCV